METTTKIMGREIEHNGNGRIICNGERHVLIPRKHADPVQDEGACDCKDVRRSAHTPTPWKAQEVYSGWAGFKITDSYGKSVVACLPTVKRENSEKQANAAFIVRAVNSHEALLEAAKKYLMYSNALDHDAQGKLIKAIARAEGK